jgi:uncharacterized protein YycO
MEKLASAQSGKAGLITVVEGGEPKAGDILLGSRRKSVGATDWLTAKTVELAQGTPFGHAAIYVGDGQVVHAHRSIPKPGVSKLPLEKFKELYDYRIYRVGVGPKARQNAADFAEDMVGKDYSARNMFGALVPRSEDSPRSRAAAQKATEFMCSQLVAAAYPAKVFVGRTVASTRPVDLAKSTSTKLVGAFKALSKTSAVDSPMPKHAAAPTGEYQGRSVSPDSVKKTVEFQGLTIKVDRPKGFVMRGKSSDGKEWERKYKYDYGFIPKTLGGDGDGLDVFIGPNKNAANSFWAVQTKPDGSFDEYKVFLGFGSREEAKAAYTEHIPAKLLDGIATLSVEMMKAMLGVEPSGLIKKTAALTNASFLVELEHIREALCEV